MISVFRPNLTLNRNYILKLLRKLTVLSGLGELILNIRGTLWRPPYFSGLVLINLARLVVFYIRLIKFVRRFEGLMRMAKFLYGRREFGFLQLLLLRGSAAAKHIKL